MEHLREKVAKPINRGELLAQRQAELAVLQFATDRAGSPSVPSKITLCPATRLTPATVFPSPVARLPVR